MKRDIVKINEDLCDGCGQCIPNCHEGALQVIDGKTRLVSDLMCDGLGACIGHCPRGAISIEQREADAYDEVKVMAQKVSQGKNTVVAHLSHLKEHGEHEFMKQGLGYLIKNKEKLGFSIEEVTHAVHNSGHMHDGDSCHSGGCPGSRTVSFAPEHNNQMRGSSDHIEIRSQLTHWPVQMHLINPAASHFQNSDLVLAADCVAFSMGDLHNWFLKGKTLAIACPKLDQGLEIYMEKIVRLIDEAKINTLTVMMMEVPCCGGLLQIVKQAVSMAKRKVPVKAIVIGIRGDILSEEWV